MEDTQLVEYIKKTDAGFGAVSEALENIYKKMGETDKILRKAEDRYTEEEEARKKEEERARLEKAHMDEVSRWENMEKSMTESITKNVVTAVLKGFQGMDVDGATPHKVDGDDVKIPENGRWPAGKRTVQEDIEVPAKLRTDTKEVQKPIQAMETPVIPPVNPMDEEKEEEYPVTEPVTKEMPSLEEIKAMFSQLIDEKLLNMQKSYDMNIKKSVSDAFRKIGYREENGLAAPKVTSLGTTNVPLIETKESTPIVKSDPSSLTNPDIDSLAKNTSFRELASLLAESRGLNKPMGR